MYFDYKIPQLDQAGPAIASSPFKQLLIPNVNEIVYLTEKSQYKQKI